ncbi:DNA polymerase delta, subunit 4-domain-containing protein [Russula earlei]|uniref:DNA polymerase delta, subunit 4-domain-containing protein n=1 Tax=Russula earlei TaxID=71964 RepID=A0ACC0TZY7_9AGAM|nr:DNA polymerase delta, subunit 4-domain-containing protein [Russula earlei]
MAPQRSSSTTAPRSTRSGGLRQGTLSFTSSKRIGSNGVKDSLKDKGKAVAASVNPLSIAPIRVGGTKRKYEPDSEPEHEEVKETVEAVERERLDAEDSRWNKAFGLAREKMGNIQTVHAQDLSPVHHILRIFDLSYEYGPCIGVTRLERWERAAALGLNPPPEVGEILMTKEGSEDSRLIQNVFHEEV